MRPEPDTTVYRWVAAQPQALLFTTYVNQAEIYYGIAALPAGRRRTRLAEAARGIFAEDCSGRILPFGAEAAIHYPEIVLTRRRAGASADGFDALIAAIALGANAQIATRDIGGFSGCGLALINPWTI